MRTGSKLRRFGLLGVLAAALAFGASAAYADDDHRGWRHKHWKKHHHHHPQRVVVVERPAYYYAPPPRVVVVQPHYDVYPAPVYMPSGNRFIFNLSLD